MCFLKNKMDFYYEECHVISNGARINFFGTKQHTRLTVCPSSTEKKMLK